MSNLEIAKSFVYPKTPRQAEKELGISKLKLQPLIEQNFLKLLNPDAKKGRLYLLTDFARIKSNREPLKIIKPDWNLLGLIIASPKQRMVILQTIAQDLIARSSEDIRKRASRLNDKLTRISTKEILKELITKDLVKTEIKEHRRKYWISDEGLKIHQQFCKLFRDKCN